MMDDKYRKASFFLVHGKGREQKGVQTARAYVRDFQTMIKDGHPKQGRKISDWFSMESGEPGRVIRLPV